MPQMGVHLGVQDDHQNTKRTETYLGMEADSGGRTHSGGKRRRGEGTKEEDEDEERMGRNVRRSGIGV
jgi:hypothetical protein